VTAERPTSGTERDRREPVIAVEPELQKIKQAGQRRTPSVGRGRGDRGWAAAYSIGYTFYRIRTQEECIA
jgi:hypothetical protein